MPNPLTIMTTGAQPHPKPEAARPEGRETKGSAFQQILDEEAAAQGDGEQALAPGQPVAEAEAEGIADATPLEAELETAENAEETPAPVAELVDTKTGSQTAPLPHTAPTVPQVDQALTRQPGDRPSERQTVLSPEAAMPKTSPEASVKPDVAPVTALSARASRTASQPQNPVAAQVITIRAASGVEAQSAKEERVQPPAPDDARAPDTASYVGKPVPAAQTARIAAQIPQPPAVDGPPSDTATTGEDAKDIQPLRDASATSSTREAAPTLHSGRAAARADTARAIAGQLAAVVTTRPGSGAVEIALNPEELGRVSITLNGREDGMHLLIAADRPETLELMRRHLSVLSAEFQKLGYGDISFDLGMSHDPQHDHHQDRAALISGADDVEPETHATIERTAPDRGLDMRL